MRAGTRRIDSLALVAACFSALTVATVAGIFLFLLLGSIPVLRHEGGSFFTSSHWAYRKQLYEAGSMIYGTSVVAVIALALAVPLGFFAAVFCSEVCSERWRTAFKFLIELLAGIPSIVYGLIGVLFLRNWMSSFFEGMKWDAPSGDTLLTAGVLLAVMILPTLTTLFDDAFRSVPASFREAARGLGLTRAETTFSVLIPRALPGLIAAVLLALGRALGETIAVFLVVGRADNRLPESGGIFRSLIDAGQTITSKLGGAETNIAVGDPLHSSALLGLALILFVVVAAVTVGAHLLRLRLSSEAAQ